MVALYKHTYCTYNVVCTGVWGYDQRTVQVLQRMQQESQGQTSSTDNRACSDQDSVEVCGEGGGRAACTCTLEIAIQIP